MAGIATALVDISTLIVSGRLETRSTLTDRFSVFDLTQTIKAVHTFAWIVAFESFFVTGMVKGTVVVLTAINAETTKRLVVGITTSGSWTGAGCLMINYTTNGVWSTGSRGARIGTCFGSA